MIKVIFPRLIILLCCISLQACTSTNLVYSSKLESSALLGIDKVKVGDKLEILQSGDNKPIILTVVAITPTEIQGEAGVAVPIEKIAEIKEVHYSWVKNTLLVIGLILTWGVNDFKNSLDNMGSCKRNCDNR